MAKRRVLGPVVVLALVLALAGCDMVRFGAKCRVGAPVARDRTHVLYCKNGKWARLVTIEQATQIIIGTLPGSTTAQNATPISAIVGGGTFTLDLKVLRRNGNVSPDTKVEVSGPGSGASVVGTATGTTDAEGLAHIPLTTSGALGTFDLTVKVNGAPDLKVPVRNVPVLTADSDKSARPVAVGFGRVVRFTATDAKGNPIPGVTADFEYAFGAVPSSVTDAAGDAFADVDVSGKVGKQSVTARAAGATAVAPLNVTPGKPFNLQVGGGVTITVARGGAGSIPTLNVTDVGGNGLEGVLITYSIIPNGPVTASAIGSPVLQTDASGNVPANGFVSNGLGGAFQIRASLPGGAIFQTFTIIAS